MDALIQCLPNLWPSHLLPRLRAKKDFPLNRSDLEFTYLGRNAVFRAVRQLGIAGAEVIAPAYHHGVEISALLAAGMHVRFARVDSAMRLDLEDVEARIGPKTAAIYVIHYAGFPQPMRPILELARDRGLLVIEDCAMALFSRDGPIPLGSLGSAAIFSFYKTVPVTHGGALLLPALPHRQPFPETRSPPLLSTLSHMTSSLLSSLELEYGAPARTARTAFESLTRELRPRANTVALPGRPQHFDPATADLGMSLVAEQVLRVSDGQEIARRRRAHWLFLHERLQELGRSPWQELPHGTCPLFYALRVEDKDRALAVLRARGIAAVDFWRSGHPSVERERFPEVEALRRQIVELPCHQDLGPEQLERLVLAAREAMGPLQRSRTGSHAVVSPPAGRSTP